MMKRSVHLLGGFFLVICGIIITPLPIPIGLILILLGLSLLVPALPVLKRWLTLFRSRFPKASDKLRRIRHRLPLFARSLVDHTEPPAFNHTTKMEVEKQKQEDCRKED